MADKKTQHDRKIIANNKRARHDYSIEETFEAGIILLGSEVKSLRVGKANITDAFADQKDGELFLFNAHIAEYKWSNNFNHQPKRVRKLLLHKREIKKLIGKLKVQGYTIVPLNIFFNHKNKVKLEIALVKGKKLYDKRQDQKQRDWDRQKQRLVKSSG